MLATLLAKLREWNILIGLCFVLGGVIFIAWILSMPPESATVALTSAGSQPPASQVASKDAAPATPHRVHPLSGHRRTRRGQADPRRRRSRRHTRCPATA